MRIAFIASECAPYAKTGGLADVVSALPQALRQMGHEVIVILPLYADIDVIRHGLKPFLSPLGVWMGNTEEWCAVHTTDMKGLPVYFIESQKYFNRWGLYHDAGYHDYLDNPRRFGFFTRAALQFCQDTGYSPDIIHAHDWQTALAPAYLKIWHWNNPVLGNTASLLTIHNIAHQGVYSADHYGYLGLQAGNFTSQKFEDHGQINFLKGGIYYSDMVNTVSPNYARETRTPEYAHGLAPYLNDKGENYAGILNGVDYSIWDPSVDAYIPAHYSAADLSGKAICKRELQQRFLLEQAPDIPLIASVSRLAAQKGLDMLAQAIEPVIRDMRAQFVILGTGDQGLERYYGNLPSRYPGQVSSYIGHSEELAHWIEAGADFFIMPSQFEPCGLNQIYSLRYGTLPVVRATGGLDDTVQQYDEAGGNGTGFKFWEPSPRAIYYAIGWAMSTYYDRPAHIRRMIQTAMAQGFSWERSATQYVEIYQRAIENKGRL